VDASERGLVAVQAHTDVQDHEHPIVYCSRDFATVHQQKGLFVYCMEGEIAATLSEWS
jgi:hypothetical protein